MNIIATAPVSAAPWQDLGQSLPVRQSIEAWTKAAGMDWRICETPVRFVSDQGGPEAIHRFNDHKVLYRSDNHKPLSVVGSRYQVVQPRQVMEFYRDLTEAAGHELETAGVLKGGRKFWALARIGKTTVLKGGDSVEAYLLLATSCDGTLATTATPTSIRVVCQNTLTVALNTAVGAIRVPHSTSFDAQTVKRQLGVAVSQWDSFMYRMKTLAERKVRNHEAMNYFLKVLCETEDDRVVSASSSPSSSSPLVNERALKKVQSLYDGQGRGSELAAAKGTAWGVLSAVTEFVDHERRARNAEYRLDSAWFGQGANLKQRALSQALQLVA
jgi:phage/plasmid-like protein (TIGR03299 family)